MQTTYPQTGKQLNEVRKMNADDIWDDLFGGFDSISRRMNEAFRQLESSGADVRTYGYTMWQGPDGVRHVREYGNTGSPAISASSREPFTDVSDDGDAVRAVAEIPGVSKSDIDLRCRRNSLSIRVTAPGREFEKELALPCEVDPGSARAEYNNGLLEVTLDKVAEVCEGTRIDIA